MGKQPEREKSVRLIDKDSFFPQQNQLPVSSIPSVLPLWDKSAPAGQAERCSLTCSLLPLLSNTENRFLLSDWGSEDLTWVTPSAFQCLKHREESTRNCSTSLKRQLSVSYVGARVQRVVVAFSRFSCYYSRSHFQTRLVSGLLIYST